MANGGKHKTKPVNLANLSFYSVLISSLLIQKKYGCKRIEKKNNSCPVWDCGYGCINVIKSKVLF